MAADRKLSPIQALEDEMVQAVVTETGWKPDLVRYVVAPIIRHLSSEYAGSRIYIPKAQDIDEAEVRREFDASGDVEGCCQRFGISRRTLYRILGKGD